MRRIAMTLAMALAAGAALADLPPTETVDLGEVRVTIYTWDFLSEDELAALRLAQTDAAALARLLPSGSADGFAAVAVSPDEEFLRDAVLIAPGQAASGLPTLEQAWTAAYDACNARRKGQTDCIIVLDVAPK